MRTLLLLLLVLSTTIMLMSMGFSEAKKSNKRAVKIPDDLDDVVDDEEDEAWKEWGRKKTVSSDKEDDDLKPSDLAKMEMSEIQAEMMKRQRGPSFGFVKLRLGVSRTKEELPMIAMRWTKVLRTGSMEVKFMSVDLSTIMFTMERGQDIHELKDFILSQPEAYEIKIGEQVYRRSGDPPLDEVIEMLHKNKDGDGTRDQDDEL